MGYSYSQDEGPRMCFNNAKNWQLGFYSDRRTVAFPLAASWTGDLVGLAEYDKSSDGQNVVLKVEGHTIDYYVGFNRKTGINSGTVEGGNQVTIQSRSLGQGYAESRLEAKLSAGGTFAISNFGGTTDTVTIEVVSISIATVPGTATVKVYKPQIATASPTTSPTATPTASPTASPTLPVTASPTASPTTSPTSAPTTSPTAAPTAKATVSSAPSAPPSKSPTKSPTKTPTASPTLPVTASPTRSPVVAPQCAGITWSKTCKRTPGCTWAGGMCVVNGSGPTPTAPTPTSPTAPAPAPVSVPTPTGGCLSYLSGKQCRVNGCVWSKGFCVDP